MSKFNFQQVKDNIEQVKRELPVLLANDAQKYFLAAFKDEGWNGVKWVQAQRRIEGTDSWKYPKTKGLSRRTKPILIDTGILRREVSLIAGRAEISYSKFNFNVKLSIDDTTVPYAEYLNDGTPKMPQRKFMGDSPALRKILKNRIERYMENVWRTN